MFLQRHLPFCSVLILLAGCADIASTPGAQAQNRENGAVPAPVGHVYCVLGWLGIWSQGMNKVVSRANAELNVKAVAVGSTEWPSLVNHIASEYAAGHITGPLVLVGHSLGADNQILVARALNRRRIPVDLLVLVDPNIPPHIPPNVRRCVNIFKSNDSLPGLRGLPVTSDHEKSAVENIDLRLASVGFDISTITHFNIAQVRGVQEMVLAEIAKTCPRRQP